MSKFVTSIPVDVKQVAEALPGGAYLEKVSWNPETSCVDVHWEHDKLDTPFTYPLPFSFEELKKNRLPKGVKLKAAKTAAAPPKTASSPRLLQKKKITANVRTENDVAVGTAPGTTAQR